MTGSDVRTFALGLPEVTEREHMGSASFRVAGKIFAQLNTDETIALVKIAPAEQAARIALDPERFSRPAHWSTFGWTYVRLQGIECTDMYALIENAWSAVAPKRLAAARARSAGPV